MAVDMGQRVDGRTLETQKAMIDAHEMFAGNIKAGARQQTVNIRHAPRHGIFDRDHGKCRRPVAQRGECLLKSRARHHVHVRITILAGNVQFAPGSP